MVLMSTITLREAFGSHEALLNYYIKHCCSNQVHEGAGIDEDVEFELEGEYPLSVQLWLPTFIVWDDCAAFSF